MTTSYSIKPHFSFWIIAVIALLWNAMGCFQWFIEYGYYTNPASREALPEAMQPLYDDQSIGIYVVFTIAVVTGLVGCIGLLLRKSWSESLFLVSLVSVIILHGITLMSYVRELGAGAMVMPILVVLFSAFLLYYAKKNKALGILT